MSTISSNINSVATAFSMSEYTDANFLLFGAIGMAVIIVVAWLLSLGSHLKSCK